MMGMIERMMLRFFQSEQNTDIRSAACHQSRKNAVGSPTVSQSSPLQQRSKEALRRSEEFTICVVYLRAPDPRGKNSTGPIVGPARVSQQARISFVHTLG